MPNGLFAFNKKAMHKKNKPTKEILEKWHGDPSNWKWGLFYYNKSDKRIFPPKRFKLLGWTVNFANPYSYLALLLLILVTMVLFQCIQ